MFFPFLLHKSSVLIAFEQIWSEKYLFKTLWKPCTPFCRLQHCAPFLGWSHISNPKKQFVFVSQAVKPQFTHDFFPWFFPYDNIIKPVIPAISCSCVVKIVWMSVNEAQHSCLFSIQHLNCFCIDQNNFFFAALPKMTMKDPSCDMWSQFPDEGSPLFPEAQSGWPAVSDVQHGEGVTRGDGRQEEVRREQGEL